MNKWKDLWDWAKSILIAIVLALLFRLFLFEVFVVEGRSMYPTLNETERVIVNKLVYRFTEPRLGDIVVFTHEPGRDFIKRVIGVEGNTVEIRDGNVYINGTLLEEPYLLGNIDILDYGPVDVPPGYFFLMGDYRHNSMDSRDQRVGFVSMDLIKGRAFFIFWPPWEARVISNKVELP
ncbi:MAG TPA: signal peptidase I [Candidatus Limnocylindrales bacterium]|nr:signal peptidase I [Candidatus Limnocylindrales bacterium]